LPSDGVLVLRIERFYGTGDLPNFWRKPYGPGWALVGDAFRDAELLADAG
jgi:hypothetical protein